MSPEASPERQLPFISQIDGCQDINQQRIRLIIEDKYFKALQDYNDLAALIADRQEEVGDIPEIAAMLAQVNETINGLIADKMRCFNWTTQELIVASLVYRGELQFDPTERKYFPVGISIEIPACPEGLTPSNLNKLNWIRENWQLGQKDFNSLFSDLLKGKGLNTFPWEEPEHCLSLRNILEEVIGHNPEMGHKKKHYKILEHTRLVLGLGKDPQVKHEQRGDNQVIRTYYIFTSEEVAQLIVGYLTALSR